MVGYLRKNEGSAIAMVIVVMAVVFLLVTGVMVVSISENQHAMYQVDEIKSYYIARAGAEAMVEELKRIDLSKMSEFDSAKTAVATNILGTSGEVEVTVERIGTSANYRVTSVGSLNGHDETVKIQLAFEDVYDIDYAVYTENDLTNEVGNDIGIKNSEGDLAAGGSISISTNDENKELTGNVLEEVDLKIDIMSLDPGTPDVKTLLKPISYSGKNGSNVMETIDESSLISNVSMHQNSDITVDTTNAEFDLVEGVTTYSFEKNASLVDPWLLVYLDGDATVGKITVTGPNNLCIIANSNLDLEGGIVQTSANFVRIIILDSADTGDVDFIMKGATAGVLEKPEQMTVFIEGADTVMDYTNSSTMYGKIYAEDGTVYMKNGNTKLYGSVYGENVYMTASTSITYYSTLTTLYSIGKAMDVSHWEE